MRLQASLLLTIAVGAACGTDTISPLSSSQVDQPTQLRLLGSEVSSIVEFHIKSGTGSGSWNTAETQAVVAMGDTLRIINDDSVVHRLHTNGKPCPHGPQIPVGTVFDCLITKEYNRTSDGDIYDHNVGPSAKFFVKVGPAPTPSPTPTAEPSPTSVPEEEANAK